MPQDKPDLWLDAVRRKLENHSEPLPDDGWDKLEKALAATPKPKPQRKVIPLRLRWLSVAATVAAIAGIAVLLRLYMPDSTNDRQAAVAPKTAPAALSHSDATPRNESLVAQAQNVSVTQAQNVSVAQTFIHRKTKSQGGQPALRRLANDERADHEPTASGTSQQGVSEIAKDEEKAATGSVAEQQTRQQATGQTAQKTRATVHHELPEEQFLALEPEKEKGHWSLLLAMGSQGTNTKNSSSSNAYSISDLSGIFSNLISTDFNGDYSSMPDPKIKMRHHMPLKFALVVEKALDKHFSVQSGITCTYLFSEPKDEELGRDYNQKAYYLGIPIKVNYNIYQYKKFMVYGGAGVELQKCISAKQGQEKKTIKKLQYALNATLGAQYAIAPHVALFLEPGVSYYWGNKNDIETYLTENPLNMDVHAGLKLTY